MKGKVLNVINEQEPYVDQLEVPEKGMVNELTEESGSGQDCKEEPQMQEEMQYEDVQKTEGTPVIEKVKFASVEAEQFGKFELFDNSEQMKKIQTFGPL